MVKIISIILILAFLCTVYAENPGIVAVIKSSIVGKAREKYFKDFMRIMGDQEIPDMTGAGISVTNIKAKLTNLDSDNLHIFFSKSHDEVAVGLANSRLDITASWKYTKLLVEISGTAEISGPLDSFGIDLEMRKVGSDNLYIPQVIKRHFNLSLYKSLFSVKLH